LNDLISHDIFALCTYLCSAKGGAGGGGDDDE